MLQTFRNHKRWLMFIATVFIVPSFVVTGIYSYKRVSQGDNAIAKVGEVYIQPEQFDQRKREQLERLRTELGESFRPNMLDNPEARATILRTLMDEAALAQAVEANYINVPESDAVALVKSAQSLQDENGKFSPELYENFLRSIGKSDQQFVYELRRDLARELLTNGVSSTAFAVDSAVNQLTHILSEERQLQTLAFNVGDFYDQMTVSDDEKKAYYDAHKDLYLAPEHMTVQYVVLSPDNFKDIKPSESDMKTYYEQNKGRWVTPEERRASHILIEFGDNKREAKAKAEKIFAEVKAHPRTFAEVAKKESADPGSAIEGGDLSFFGRGMMVPAFEEATFAAKKGDIIGPVETEFGYHIIYVTDIRASAGKKFEEVKDEIIREYAEQMAIRAFSESADEFTNMVYELSDSLDPIARKFHLQIETAQDVTRDGVADPNLRRLLNEHVIEQLYGTEALVERRNTSAVEVAPNTLVAARVVEHFPQKQLTLEEVSRRVGEAVKIEKAKARAKKAGEAKLAELVKSKDLDDFSKPVWASRSIAQGMPEALLNKAIAYPADKLPAFIGTRVRGGAYIIAYVAATREAKQKRSLKKSLADEMKALTAEVERRAYLEGLKASLGVEILKKNFVSGEEAPAR